MADIVQSPFGLTPEAYRQQQANEASRMALGYAQLTPQQRASFGAARAGYQLGEVLGGALGGQDPMLQIISNRQAIARQIDYTNPESMSAGIQALSQAGDTVGAIQLSQVLRQMQSEMAERQQRLAAAGASEAAAAASRAAAERDRTPESLLRARRRGEITRLLGRPSELTAEDVQALEAETRSLMSKEELEAEEVRRQTAGYQTMIGGAQAPAARAAAEPGLMEDLASMGVFAPSQAPSMAAQPAATAETGDLAAQLAQAREEFNRVSRFPKVPEAVGRAAQLKPIIENLEKRLVNVRLDDQYRAFLAGNPNALQAPEASLSAREQLAARQAQLTRISDLAASGSPLARRDEDFIKEEIKALRSRIGKEEEPFNAGQERDSYAQEMFDGKKYRELTPAQMARVNQRIQREKESVADRTAARIKIENKGLEAFAQGRGKAQAELLNEATLSARGASQALSTISNMKQLNASGQLFTGPLANPVLGASSLLASVGLISPEQRNRLTSSEVYDKQAKDLVMQDLGGKLGAQISDADRKFVEARIPQLTTSAQARTELLNKLEEIQRGKIDFYRRANAHANQFGNLNTFDFSQQYSPVAPAGGWSIRRVEPAK